MAAYPPADNRPEKDDRQSGPFYTAPTRRLDNPTGQLTQNSTQSQNQNQYWQSPHPVQYLQSYQPVYMPTARPKDPNTAMVIEILAGFFGFMGIGYLYAGYTLGGLVRLLGWFFCLFMAAIMTLITLGFGLICFFPLVLIAPVVSGLLLKQKLERDQARKYYPSVYT